jgi:hypothetical protein
MSLINSSYRPREKNQHHRRQQVTVHHLDDVGDGVVVQHLASLLGHGRIGVMGDVRNQVIHVHGGHVENGEPCRHAGDNCKQYDIAAAPQCALKHQFQPFHRSHAPPIRPLNSLR